MNIEREETGTLTATLRVKLTPEDYATGVEKALKEQRKSASLPGFRPGQVPMNIIKKRVGRAVLVNEVERLIGETLNSYIRDNKLKVLGQPLPKNEPAEINNWEEPGDFSFSYEMGLAPELDVQLSEKLGMELPVVDVNDELVQREIADMQRRFGQLENGEVSEDKDMLLGDMIELNVDGTIKEGGIMNRATISLEYLADQNVRSTLVGKAVGDEVMVDPYVVSSGAEDLARMLGIEQDQVPAVGNSFLFRIAEIKRMLPVAIGQELFDRVYGKDAVTDEGSFRAKVKEGIDGMFRRDGDRLFLRRTMKKLEEIHDVQLPDGFLKRWIRETSQQPMTPEDVEAGYAGYAEGLRRQLLQDRIIEKYGLEAKGEELDAFSKRYISDQFVQYGMPAPEGEQLQQMSARILGDREQLEKMRNTIVEQKLLTHFKAMLSPKEKVMSYDEFVNLARSL